MASKQTSGSETRKAEGARSGAAATRSKGGSAQTGERDEHYDVVSVLYHSLQGAETCERYISDARNARDQELLSFFEDTRSEYASRAAQAKELLAARLESGARDEMDDDEDDDLGEDDDSDDDED